MTAATEYTPGRNGTATVPPVLRIDGLSKTFGATRALIDAALDIRPGEIHALVGQNGSGKSTLIKTLAGYHAPDAGSAAELDGASFQLGHAVPDGLRFVHQDLGLVLELNAMDNLALHGGFARGAMGRVHWSEQEQETRRVLARFGVDLDIHRPLAAATPVERTVVAIAAALQGWQGGSGVLVLDEPTAVLPHDEVERLFAMVREVRAAGTSVLYVSHRLDEIFELADRVTVLRGGRVIATREVADIDAAQLASLMVGEDVDPDYRAPVAARPDAPVVLEARDVHGRWLRGVDLDVHRGEILGIAGLAGAGRARAAVRDRRLRTARRQRPHPPPGALAGMERRRRRRRPRHPARPRRPRARGDRRRVRRQREPVAVRARAPRPARPARQARGGPARRAVDGAPRRRHRRACGAPISTLSGGNQQKVVVARCLARDPALLVLCEPTAGVDIGTRVAIYDLIAELSRNGLTVVLSSSDAGDVLAMCTRVVVLRGGQVAAELGGEGLTEHALVSAMEGEDR